MKKKYVGIYVHIPFCNSRCYYCNFNTYVIEKKTENSVHKSYVEALIKEIENAKNKMSKYSVNTIFIGGGTPSILTSNGISLILNAIKKHFKLTTDCEITLEVNPNAFKIEDAISWKEAGVNRISVGLQTSNNNLLKTIGRTHTQHDFVNTMQTLKRVGFTNISCDLMLGLPNQTLKDVKDSLNLSKKQGIKHISAYSLILEDETVLSNLVKLNKLTLPDENVVVDMYDLVYKNLKKSGFKRYEVSNFSKKNYESRHNVNCWKMFSYLGFGAGAHSFFENNRFSNEKTIHGYINKINNSGFAHNELEKISNEELIEETILLGLRTKYGFNINEINELSEKNILEEKKHVINNFIKMKLIALKNGRIYLRNKGYYVLNKIILDLVT